MMKVKAEDDFFYFAHYICEFGKNPDQNGPRITEDQHSLCNHLQAFYNNPNPETWLALILTPRDTLKSTVLQAFVLWIIIKNPDVRILLYAEVHEQAQKRLAVIKRIIQQAKRFRLCYGDLDGSKKGLPWNENLFVSAQRNNTAIREGTVETAGLDVVVNSRHYDWMFPDDLHSEKNTKTKDQIEEVKDQFRNLLPLKSKGGKICVAGVFWNDSDVHTWLKDENNPEIFLQSIYKEDGITLNYPTALPQNEIDLRKKTLRADMFSCQYLLDAVAADAFKFRREYFTIIPRAQFRSIRNYLLIDPAGDPTAETASKRDSDYVGQVVWAMNAEQDWMLLDGFHGKVSPTEAVEEAMLFILKYKPFITGVERAGMGNMKHYLSEEMRKKGMYSTIVDTKPEGRSKTQRVFAMEPQARRRKMYIAEECPIKEDFIEEAIRFPKAKHDDLIDPTAYMLDLLRDYGTPVQDDSDDDDAIPADLAGLNQMSRDYWMAIRKKENQVDNWVVEFFA